MADRFEARQLAGLFASHKWGVWDAEKKEFAVPPERCEAEVREMAGHWNALLAKEAAAARAAGFTQQFKDYMG